MDPEIKAKLYELGNELSPEIKLKIEYLVTMAPIYVVALSATALEVYARRARGPNL